MNIPEMTIEMKQGLRSENVVPAKTVSRPPGQKDTSQSANTDSAPTKTEKDKQSTGRTKEELYELIAEAEKHLEANDIKLKFNVLENNDTIQVEVLDSDGKVIRKIPDDDLIKLTKSLKNLGQGFLNEVY
ncbi:MULTISPECIES: flagellar protein FlaG [unclassified Pseudodesulfovibrio]|uniref:flagellar protein FlaG n=1 Tax=unclassified Pseudodesulfovibrio TaxID=2661612 RepID=UPI000FEB8649|nr:MULTISPECIES: flagellar protein FlaG [unclassified Pseudodesulfovibrio]MCJ2163811.1 flagellar protein FlaG [Pseudodesulfovibrio sp. S3-i]RWU05941.1 flagellar biosynthesis protein FlaG [Pseudodesulfovibrio sp. S3]